MLDDLAQRQASRLPRACTSIMATKALQVGARLAGHGGHGIVSASSPLARAASCSSFNAARANAARREVHHPQEAGVVVRGSRSGAGRPARA